MLELIITGFKLTINLSVTYQENIQYPVDYTCNILNIPRKYKKCSNLLFAKPQSRKCLPFKNLNEDLFSSL